MNIHFELDNQSPKLKSFLKAAQSAMSTAVITEGKSLDLSRLTLLGFSLKLHTDLPNTLEARCMFEKTAQTDFGELYLAKMEFLNENLMVSQVEFEILNRKRGLTTQTLKLIQVPESNFGVAQNTLVAHFEDDLDLDYWALDFLFAAAWNQKPRATPPFSVHFRVFDAALAKTPCQISVAKDHETQLFRAEIHQGDRLIAHVIENYVL